MYVDLIKHDGKGTFFILKRMSHTHNPLHALRTEIIPRNHIRNLVNLSEPNKCCLSLL